MIDRRALQSEFNERGRAAEAGVSRARKRLGFAICLRIKAQAGGYMGERYDQLVDSMRAELRDVKAAIEEARASFEVAPIFESVMHGAHDPDVMELLEGAICRDGAWYATAASGDRR